jgi:methylated-DNA-[protein]-cysteine S-methyltransferase
LASPIGELLLLSDGEALTTVLIEPSGHEVEAGLGQRQDDGPLVAACQQLRAYFAGERIDFDLPLAPCGTDFQRRVWDELRRIPFGATTSYRELARRIGHPTAVRAVGAANGRNPLPIIVPCHRVIGADGTLVGYGGGLERKQWLLRHEAEVCARHAHVAHRQMTVGDCATPARSASKEDGLPR